MYLLDKIVFGEATLSDQEEALQDCYVAYYFARFIKGADINRCQEVACKEPFCAYLFAKYVK